MTSLGSPTSIRTSISSGGGGSKKICMVCGDKSLGYNFNAITCESCKAFFRRNALSNKEFTCPFNGDCKVTVITRRFCQKCRLQKCFQVGMKKEFIMSEEDKVLKRKKIEQNRAKKRSPNSYSSDNGVPSIKMKKELFTNDDSDGTSSDNSKPNISHNLTSVITNKNQLQGFNYTSDVPSPDNENNLNATQSPQYDEQQISSPQSMTSQTNLSQNFSDYSPQYPTMNNQSKSSSPNAITSTTNEYNSNTSVIQNDEQNFTNLNNPLTKHSSPTELVCGILNNQYGAKYVIDSLMKTPEDAMFVISKILNSSNDAIELISHFITSPGDALHIISKIMNSPLDALTVFTHFMSSPNDASQIIEKIMSSPSDVLQFMQQLMNSPENAVEIMDKFMNSPVEALKIINKMISNHDIMVVDSTTAGSSTASVIQQTSNDYYNHHEHVDHTKGEIIKSMIQAFKKQSEIDNAGSVIQNNLNNPNSSSSCDNFNFQHNGNHEDFHHTQKTEEIIISVIEDIEKTPMTSNSFESMLCEAIRLEYESYNVMEQSSCNGLDLNSVENNKLTELIYANEALYEPVDDEYELAACRVETNPSQCYPELLRVINLTAVAVRRLIKMAKKINAFKNMCQEDQLALLKGGCIEMMILRSVMQFDEDQNTWKIPYRQAAMGNIKADVLKLAKGNMYEKHKTFISNFDKKWRSDTYIIPIMCAITLFTPDRSRTVHYDVIKLEQTSYYCLLRRYLESVYPGCEAKSTFLKLIDKIHELKKLNEEVINVYLDVHPSQIEPLLLEIFDLKSSNI